jgi:hypothetical protein
VIDEKLFSDRGWQQDADGTWCRPGLANDPRAGHVHNTGCTTQSCGDRELFFCAGAEHCMRVLRRDGERRPCMGHPLPSRETLTRYSLQRRGLVESAPRGTPLEDDVTNTWSDEREGRTA